MLFAERRWSAFQNWTAVVRWDAPVSRNGVISLYRLTVWQGDGIVFSSTTVNGSLAETQLTGLRENATYGAEVGDDGMCVGLRKRLEALFQACVKHHVIHQTCGP